MTEENKTTNIHCLQLSEIWWTMHFPENAYEDGLP